MLELIKACYELQALRGRERLGKKLSSAQAEALTHLERVFGPPGGEGVALRLDTRAPLTFKSKAGQETPGMVCNISSTGLFVETAEPLNLKAQCSLRIRDTSAGREYHFACEVCRVSKGGMGLRFTGIPVECRYHASDTLPPGIAKAA